MTKTEKNPNTEIRVDKHSKHLMSFEVHPFLKFVFSLFLVLIGAPSLLSAQPSPIPLTHVHAHNDYEHARPLLDALDHGFCSVEADIWLVPEGLLIGHDRKDLRPGRTLQALYLDPLRERIQANGGRVYRGGSEFYLLMDVKTHADETYAALDKVLAS